MQIKEREPITVSLSKKTIERLHQMRKAKGIAISQLLERSFLKEYGEDADV